MIKNLNRKTLNFQDMTVFKKRYSLNIHFLNIPSSELFRLIKQRRQKIER